jgi:phosphoribosyl-ATP pyrophosphohydrolase
MSSADNKGTIINSPASMEVSLEPSLPIGDAIDRLWAALDDHVKLHAPVPDRTARLVIAGEPKMAQKVVEEAGEVAIAAMLKDRAEVIRESADLVYHLTILWAALDIKPEQVWAEMAERESVYGLAEKRAKPPRHGVSI